MKTVFKFMSHRVKTNIMITQHHTATNIKLSVYVVYVIRYQ